MNGETLSWSECGGIDFFEDELGIPGSALAATCGVFISLWYEKL